jgi:hypothetical protein
LVCVLTLGILASPLVTALDTPAAPAPSTQVDPEAKTALDRLGAFYKALNSFTVDNTITMNSSQGTTQESMKLDYHIAVARPDKLAMTLGESKFGAVLYRNGPDLAFYMPMMNQYALEQAPSSLYDTAVMAVLNGPSSFLSIVASLMAGDPAAQILEGVTEAKYVGLEDLNGIKHAHVKLVQEEIDYDLWIDAGERPLLTKVVPDFAKAMAKEPKQPGEPDAKITVEVAFANWAANATIPGDRFTFTPPDGAVKADSIAKALGMKEEEPSPLLGTPAPDFTLDLLDGAKLTLADHKGKDIVVLDFWATWCGPCRKGLPIVSKVTSDVKDKGVVFYAVNQREEKDRISAFLQNEGLKINVALDTNGDVGDLYGVSGIPQTVIIGKDGTVQAVHVGLIPGLEQTLRKQLDTLISGGTLAFKKQEKPAA